MNWLNFWRRMDDKIVKLRKELDALDDKIAGLVAERVEIGRKIVKLKRESGLATDDFNRENEILKRLSTISPADSKLLEDLYKRIFDWVKNQ